MNKKITLVEIYFKNPGQNKLTADENSGTGHNLWTVNQELNKIHKDKILKKYFIASFKKIVDQEIRKNTPENILYQQKDERKFK